MSGRLAAMTEAVTVAGGDLDALAVLVALVDEHAAALRSYGLIWVDVALDRISGDPKRHTVATQLAFSSPTTAQPVHLTAHGHIDCYAGPEAIVASLTPWAGSLDSFARPDVLGLGSEHWPVPAADRPTIGPVIAQIGETVSRIAPHNLDVANIVAMWVGTRVRYGAR